MGQRRPQGGRHDKGEFVPRYEFEKAMAELRGEIQRSERQIPVWINIEPDPGAGPGGDDTVTWRFRGTANRADGATEIVTDETAPGSSPTPTVTGAISVLFIRWTPIVNADSTTYEVHLSTTTGFTPDASTLLTDTQGFMVTTRTLPDGTPLAQGTTYYAKIIAKDADGSATASAQGSGTLTQVTEPDIATDAIIARHILAEEIQSEHLAAVLVLANTIIAGQEGAERVEIGLSSDEEDGFIGIRAFDSEGLDTLRVDAQTGEVYIKGEVGWGSQSSLEVDDIIQIAEQPIGFSTAYIRQRSAGASYASGGWSTITRTFGTAPIAGNCLVAHIFQFKQGTTTPTAVSTPAGWTLIQNDALSAVFGTASANYRARAQTFMRYNAPVISSLGFSSAGGTPTHVSLTLLEVANVLSASDPFDNDVFLDNSSDPIADTNNSATLAQTHELGVSFHTWMWAPNDHPSLSAGDPWSLVNDDGESVTQGSVFSPSSSSAALSLLVTQTAYSDRTATTAFNHSWIFSGGSGFLGDPAYYAYLMTLKAKVASVDTAPALFTRIYGKYAAAPDATVLHTISEDGVEMSLVGGPPDKRYRIEQVEATYDLPSINAHTSGTNLDFTVTQGASIANVKAGDIIIFTGFDEDDLAVPVSSSLIFTVESIASADGHIKMRVYNAHTAAIDVGSVSFQFLVIHLG